MALPSISGRHARALGWGTAALAALPWAAQAQDTSPLPSFVLERLEVNPGRGPLALAGAALLPEDSFRVTLLGHYQRDPLTLDGEGTQLSLVRHRMTGVLAMAWGVLPWLELDAQLPVLSQREGVVSGTQGITTPSRGGIGAPRIGGRLGLMSRERDEAVDLAVELGWGLPVGSATALARERGSSLLGRVMVGGHWGDSLAPAFEAGVLLRPTTVLDTGTLTGREAGSELRLGGALVTTGPVLRGELDMRASLSFAQAQTTLEVLGGARYTPGPGVELFALGGLGFGSEPGTPLFRLLAGVAFTHLPYQEPEPDIVHESVPLQRRAPEAPPAPAPLATLSRERLALNGQVFFDTGSAELPTESPVLDQAARLLLEHPEIDLVTIDGHTDAVGQEGQNRELGRERAEAVWRYLVRRGVPTYRLRVRSFGPERPAEPNNTPEGREKNRRVEVLLSLPLAQETRRP